jgi:hypothetical protein
MAAGGSSPITTRARGLSTMSSSSCALAATLASTWDDVPLRSARTHQPELKNGSREEEEGRDGAEGDGDNESGGGGDDTETRARAAQTWSAGTKLQRPSSVKVSQASSTFDEWMQQSREEDVAGATPPANGSSSRLSPDHSPLPTSGGAINVSSSKKSSSGAARRKSAGGSDQEEDARKKKERTRKSKSTSGERKKKRLSKGGKAGEEINSGSGSAKKPSASTTEGKQHKRRKSRDRNVDASIKTEPDDTTRAPPEDDLTNWSDSSASSPPNSPHK